MKKPKKQGRLDFAQLAKAVVDAATDESPPVDDGKDPAAVARGRLGGQKGGIARAAKLGQEKRKQIAKRAAATRWAKRKTDQTPPA